MDESTQYPLRVSKETLESFMHDVLGNLDKYRRTMEQEQPALCAYMERLTRGDAREMTACFMTYYFLKRQAEADQLKQNFPI